MVRRPGVPTSSPVHRRRRDPRVVDALLTPVPPAASLVAMSKIAPALLLSWREGGPDILTSRVIGSRAETR
jgi:hypothetical protein